MQKTIQLSDRQKQKITELNKQMSEEIMQLMHTHDFPTEFIHEKFQDWLTIALPHETAAIMKASYPEFKKFYLAMNSKKATEFNMWEMGFALNCVESKSQAQLKANTPEIYIAIQDAIGEMMVRWNEAVNAMKQPITDRYKTLMEMVRDNKPIIMPNKEIVS